MEQNNPKVSVIIPTYNRVDLLPRAIKSVFDQTFLDYEVIIINDASTDGTKKYLDELAKNDSRVKVIHHEKNYYPDISRTLNEGLNLARGKYIARLDDDDYWSDKEKLAKQVAFLDARQDYVIVGGGTIVIDEKDQERFRYLKLETNEAIRSKALVANPFTHSTVMFLRDVAVSVGGYGNFKNAEDWDLWLKMGTRGNFYNFQEYFVKYLITDKNKSFLFKRSQSKEILKIISAHRKEYPNFYIAYAINFAQYIYSFLPFGIRKMSHSFLSKIKRKVS
jgi:glycosyltransferase involved in cell wall biosynthesis